MQKYLNAGFCDLIDSFGSDLTIVESARISYGQYHADNTEKLIRFLLKNKHMSPFEMCQMRFFISAPIFVARQLMRYRTAKINEISARYTKIKPVFFIPAGLSVEQESTFRSSYEASYESYLKLLSARVKKELARAVVPTGLYTQFYYSIDLRNFFNIYAQRSAKDAQSEISQLVELMMNAALECYPTSCREFLAQ